MQVNNVTFENAISFGISININIIKSDKKDKQLFLNLNSLDKKKVTVPIKNSQNLNFSE